MINTEHYYFEMGYKISKALKEGKTKRIKELMRLFNDQLIRESDQDQDLAKFIYSNGFNKA
jgi:hypothetical protein